MNHNSEILAQVYKDADMGASACNSLLNFIKDKNNKIKDTVEDILKEYESFKHKSVKLLEKEDGNYKENSMFSKMMSDMGIKKEVKIDNSDSAIASMLIEGLNMGLINIEKNTKDYKDKIDKKVIKLCKEFTEFQNDSIEKLKSFL